MENKKENSKLERTGQDNRDIQDRQQTADLESPPYNIGEEYDTTVRVNQ